MGFWWVEAREAAKNLRYSVSSPTTKKDSAPNMLQIKSPDDREGPKDDTDRETTAAVRDCPS
jgi:hypothetical protein